MKTKLDELHCFLFDRDYVILLDLYEELENISFSADRSFYGEEYEQSEIDYLVEEAEYDFKVLYYRNEELINKIKEVIYVVDLVKEVKEPYQIETSSRSESTYITYEINDLDKVLDFIYTNGYISRYYNIDNFIEEYDYTDRQYFTIRISTHDTGQYIDMTHGGISYYDKSDVEVIYKF